MTVPAAAHQTQPTDPPSLHYLEQLAKQRAIGYLATGNYDEAMWLTNALYMAQCAVKYGNEDVARDLLSRTCELTR